MLIAALLCFALGARGVNLILYAALAWFPVVLHCYLRDASRRSAEGEAVLSSDYVNHPVKSLFHSDVLGLG